MHHSLDLRFLQKVSLTIKPNIPFPIGFSFSFMNQVGFQMLVSLPASDYTRHDISSVGVMSHTMQSIDI